MAAQSSAHNAYKQNSVTTASPGELTLMLYNGCLKFLMLAKRGMERKDIEVKNNNLQKAQAIITELILTLDMDAPISSEIKPLYEYMNRRLIEANVKSDTVIVDEVIGLVTDFRDTWKEVMQLNRPKQSTAGGDQV